MDFHDMNLTAPLALVCLLVAVVTWMVKRTDGQRPLRRVSAVSLLLGVALLVLTFLLSLTIP
ncbi:hypothetical protein D3875_15325 [Deinococcus cavernae]|uniref:Uncharacterized protein n=1 Tax=Deinococcus cavernae TaxID=2320857 RepID=A0A418V9A9_9DEIO|nr:hypothetical protein [Deinococcus cavernae]RJF72705.1 hypothetical protein D3875_15325 [Deinococcus cavernae]